MPIEVYGAKQLCDRPLQVGELDRFGEVFGETCGETTFAILFHAEAAHGDGEYQPSLLPIQALQQMSSRTVWQADIGNQDIKLERFRKLEGLRDATGNTNLMTFPGKQKTKAFVCILVVIHDEDPNRSQAEEPRWCRPRAACCLRLEPEV